MTSRSTAPNGRKSAGRVQSLKTGAIAQVLPLAANYGVNLLATPFVVGQLGLHDFGVWAMTGAIAQYAALLDLGAVRAANRYVALFHARGETEKERSVLGICVTTALGLSARCCTWRRSSVRTPPKRSSTQVIPRFPGFFCCVR